LLDAAAESCGSTELALMARHAGQLMRWIAYLFKSTLVIGWPGNHPKKSHPFDRTVNQ